MVDGKEFPSLSRWHISGQIMDHAIEVRFSERLQIVVQVPARIEHADCVMAQPP